MPLITFSRFLSPKSDDNQSPDTGKPQFLTPSPSKTSPSPVSPRSFYNTWSGSRKTKEPGSSRSKARESSTFDPFNVFASFRSRSKAKVSDSEFISASESKSTSKNTHSSYSGYVDDDYGEPEAENEEIRRPSGLGRRASIVDLLEGIVGEAKNEAGDGAKGVPVTPNLEGTAVQSDTAAENTLSDSRTSSDTYDDEELAEIRYPSGLGNFKVAIKNLTIERPLSTYPLFELDHMVLDRHSDDASVASIAWDPASRLSTIVPLLGPYLPRKTLLSLTLVNHAVAEESQRLLWKDISVRLNISSASSNKISPGGNASAVLLDILSTRHELANLVESLDLSCQLESIAPSSTRHTSSRSRPPPLILSSSSKSIASVNPVLLTPSEPAHPHTTPSPSKTHIEHSPGEDIPSTPDSVDKRRSLSKLRRASSLLRPSLLVNINVPDVLRPPAVKVRPPSMQLPRRLSLLQKRSLELLGRSPEEASSSSRDPPPPNDEPGVPVPSFKPLALPGESTWTPPDEWAAPESPRFLAARRTVLSLPSRGSSAAQSPSPSPPSTAGWKAPTEWEAAPSGLSSLVSLPRLQPSLPTLRTRPPPSPTSPSSNKTPSLRASPSLPSMRALRSSIYQEQEPSSPVTTPPSPVTPFSPISLSAFPLPPQISTPPSVPPLPVEFTYPNMGDSTPIPVTPSTPLPTQHENQVGLLQTPRTALSNMPNVANVTLVFTLPPESSDSSVSDTIFSLNEPLRPWANKAHAERFDPKLITDVNRMFVDIFSRMKSLKSLKIVYPVGHEVYRQQWLELKCSLKDVEVDITSL